MYIHVYIHMYMHVYIYICIIRVYSNGFISYCIVLYCSTLDCIIL